MSKRAVGRPKSDPKLGKIPVNLRLPFWLVAWLKDQDQSQAVIIEKALLKQYNLKPPRPSKAEDQESLF